MSFEAFLNNPVFTTGANNSNSSGTNTAIYNNKLTLKPQRQYFLQKTQWQMFQLLVPVVEQGVQSAAAAEQSSDLHLVTKSKMWK